MSLRLSYALPLLLIPMLAAGEPLMIGANQSVSPLRPDSGDGVCATLVQVGNPQQPPFTGTSALAEAIDQLNTTGGAGGSRMSAIYRATRFHNNEATAIGDFSSQPGQAFPYESNFAARVRGYVSINRSVDPSTQTPVIYSDAIYAIAGARLRIGGLTAVQFDSAMTDRSVQQLEYARTGLFPVEIIYYANGGQAVLEASSTPTAQPVGPQTSLNTGTFQLIPTSQLYTSRMAKTGQMSTSAVCTECSQDSACGMGNYCVHDWTGGDVGLSLTAPSPDGICQQCAANDHCGPSCTACTGGTPVCSNGTCVQCTIDDDCPLGQQCKNNACVFAPPCTRTSCPAGDVCYPNTLGCVTPCSDDTQCPYNLVCDTSMGTCTRACTMDSQCRLHEVCNLMNLRCEPSLHYAGGAGCSVTSAEQGRAAALAGLWPLLLGLLGLGLVRRRRRAALVAALVFFAQHESWAQAPPQQSLTVNAQTFQPALGPENVITVEGSRTPLHLRPVLMALVEYADRPLYLRAADGTVIGNTVPNMTTVHLMGGLGLTRWLAVGVSLPVVVYQSYDSTAVIPGNSIGSPSSTGIGDLRLVVKWRIINNQGGGFGLAFVPQATFPTGSATSLRGDYDSTVTANGIYGIEPRFALDYRSKGGSFLALNAGFLGRTGNQIVGTSQGYINIDSQVTYGLGGHLALPKGFGLLAEVTGRVAVGTGLNQSGVNASRYTPTEIYGGVRWAHRSGLNVMAGAGGGLVDEPGSPRVRVFAAVGYLPVARHEAPPPEAPPPHRAHKLLLTVNKSGSGLGEVESGPGAIRCGKVCTDEFTAGTDVVLIARPGPDSTFVGWSGPCSGIEQCVVNVRERTTVGVEFAQRVEPRATLTVDKAGEGTGQVISGTGGITCGKVCMATYKIGQEITLRAEPTADSWFAGWEGPCSGTGPCTMVVEGPTTLRAKFNQRKLEIKNCKIDLKRNTINFKTGDSEILPESHILLDEVVSIMQGHPEINGLKIEGHTDNQPFRNRKKYPGGNLLLSQERAKAVLDYLIGHGIVASRLTSEGYGETCPIVPNDSKEGMATNRRTEFWIVGCGDQVGEPPSKECHAKSGAQLRRLEP